MNEATLILKQNDRLFLHLLFVTEFRDAFYLFSIEGAHLVGYLEIYLDKLVLLRLNIVHNLNISLIEAIKLWFSTLDYIVLLFVDRVKL